MKETINISYMMAISEYSAVKILQILKRFNETFYQA